MKRIVPGLLIAGFWLLLLLFGSAPMFNLVVLAIVLVGADEYVRMAFPALPSPVDRFLLDGIIALPVFTAFFQPIVSVLLPSLVGAFALSVIYGFYRYRLLEDCFSMMARLMMGILYIGFLGAHLILLRTLPEGASWLLIATAITGSSDSGAYFTGKRFGKRKLCPNISPNKTIEGALGGLLCALVASVLFAMIILQSFHIISLVFVTIVLTGVGIAGDLTESIIKRGTGTKDSGRCLAGHGGILDRVDSLLFVAPVLYYFLIYSVL